jgi:xanthine dehydrogenase accessory factor
LKQKEFARVFGGLVERREPFVLATVVKIEGSSLGKPGFKAILSRDGEPLYGSLGGACPESAISGAAKTALRTGNTKVVRVYLESVEKSVEATIRSETEDEVHVETNCGGVMDVYVEPYFPQQTLFLIGQGGKDDIEDSLVKLGKALDFEVIVVDHAPMLKEEPDELIKDMDFDLSKLKVGESDSVVVLTRGARDVEVLEALSKFRPRFVGLVGSRQRAAEDIAELRKRGVPSKFIDSIRAPVGADIGAITPAEIALSIVVDMVAVKYGKSLPQKLSKELASVALSKSAKD